MSLPRQRRRRGEPLPAATTLLLRGDALDPLELAETAEDNLAVYGFYGVSVFAEVNGMVLESIAARRLARHEWLVVFRAGDLLEAGLELWDTGQSPHYDVVHEDKTQLVSLMAGCAHRLLPNAHYDPPEGGA